MIEMKMYKLDECCIKRRGFRMLLNEKKINYTLTLKEFGGNEEKIYGSQINLKYDTENSKIISYDENLLNECIENEDYDKIVELAEVKNKQFWKNDSNGIIVEYFYKGYGIASAGLYTGFYYTSADEPIGFQGATHKLTKAKNGWEWKEPNGDNFDYTEKITDHWYYYKAGF